MPHSTRPSLPPPLQPPSAAPAAGQQPPADPPLLPLGAIAAGFGMMLGAGLACAQTSAPPPVRETTLPEIKVRAAAEETAKEALQTNTTTIGKGTQEIRDVPQSLTVVTEKLIDDVKLDTLRQALHYTAGITFAATENGTDQDIRMRGFPVATTGDLLIDGMKDPSQYDRDSFNYDRIEILRGSASMLFGRGSTGGVINQVSKQPQLVDLSEVVTTVGTGTSVRFTGDFNVRTGEQSAVRVNAMVQNAKNFGAKIDKQGLAPTVRWGIGSRDEFSLGAFLLKVDNVAPSSFRYVAGSIASAIPPRNFYGTASDYLLGDATYGSGSWLHRFDGGGELRTQFRVGQFKRSGWFTVNQLCNLAPAANGSCPAGGAVTNDTITDATRVARLGLAPRRDEIVGNYIQSDYSNRFNWFGMRHEIVTGVDAAIESADRFGAWGTVGTNYNKGDTLVGTPNDGRITPAVPVYRKTSDYKGKAFGAYFQDLIAFTPVWKLLAGVRYDRFEADMHQVAYPNASSTDPSAITPSKLKYPELWSGRVGLLFQPTPAQSYHVSYGTSFNTSADTYQYTTQQIADVPAEESRNIEVGAKLDWLDGQLSTRVAIYRTEKYNERTTDADFAVQFPVLSGKRHSQGVELDVVGRITPALEVYLSYAYMDEATIDRVGTAVTGAGGTSLVGSPVGLSPRHTGAAWLSWQLTPSIRIAGGARGASENRPLQGGTGAASTTAKVPGYVAYDAMAEYTFNEDVYAQINVNNVSDKVYGDQLYPAFYTPGEGRSVKLTLGVKF